MALLRKETYKDKAFHRGWRKPRGRRMFIGHFSQKSPIISGSFAKNDLQLKASYGFSPPFTTSVPCISAHDVEKRQNKARWREIGLFCGNSWALLREIQGSFRYITRYLCVI